MLKKLLPLLLGLLIALCGLAACEETPNPGPGPDPQPSDPTFEVLSTLEFYNWNDTKDLVISYEGTGSVDSVSVGTTALRSSDYTAEDGVLIISQAALDSFVEGKYSLVIKSGERSEELVLFVGEQIQNGSRYVRRQPARGADVDFFFDAQGETVSVKNGDAALTADQFSYDAENYKLTVKASYLDTLTAQSCIFTAAAGERTESFSVSPSGGAGKAASYVLGGTFGGVKDVGLTADLGAVKTEYEMAADGVKLTGAPEALVFGSGLEQAVYQLTFSVKTEAAYLTLFYGEEELLTLTEDGLLSQADDRTTAVKAGDFWKVSAYFTGGAGALSFRKGASDVHPVTLAAVDLVKTKMSLTNEEIDLGEATYYVGGVSDISAALPFDVSLIEGVSMDGAALSSGDYRVENGTLTVLNAYLADKITEVNAEKQITVAYTNVLDAAGNVSDEANRAVLTVKGAEILAMRTESIVVWDEGHPVSFRADAGGGAVTGVKVNQKEIGSDLYALEDGVLTIEADAFAEVTTTLTVIEVSNDKGTSVIYAHKGAAVATLNAESGAYEEGYDFYVQSTQDGSIVSGKDALSGNYSYYRYGAATKDNWNTFLKTAGGVSFVNGDYYMISFRIKVLSRDLPETNQNYNELRTLFEIPNALSEITYDGRIKADNGALSYGKASVYQNADGSMNISLTLPALTGVLEMAFCFPGSVVFDDLVIYHLEEQTVPDFLIPAIDQPITAAWNGQEDFVAEVEFTSAAAVKVNGEALDPNAYSIEDNVLTIKRNYLAEIRSYSYAIELTEGEESATIMVVYGESVWENKAGGSSAVDGVWNHFFTTGVQDNFVSGDYYMVTYKISTVRDLPESQKDQNEIRTYVEGLSSYSEISYQGAVIKDDYSDTWGASRVVVLEDGSMLLSVALKMADSKEIIAAYCYKGSATWSGIIVTHVGSELRSNTEAPASNPVTLAWDGAADFSAAVTFTDQASVKVNGTAVGAEHYSLSDYVLTLKRSYLDTIQSYSYVVELTEGDQSASFIVVRGDVVAENQAGGKVEVLNETWNTFYSTGVQESFVVGDYYTIAFEVETTRVKGDDFAAFSEIRIYAEGGSFNEIKYNGDILKDYSEGTAGAARVIKLGAKHLIVSVTVQMTASKEIKAAFCYEGSATYSNVVVTHVGSTLEIAAPASTVSWDGTGDLFVPVTVAAAGVKVNGAAVDAENYSLKNFGLTLKKAYLDSLSANAYAVELTGVSEPFGFIAVKGDVVAENQTGGKVEVLNQTWNTFYSTGVQESFVVGDYYTIAFEVETTRVKGDDFAAFSEIRIYAEGGSFNEIKYNGDILKDYSEGTAGAARVIKLGAKHLIISVTVQMTANKEIKAAFCYEGSAVYSNVIVTHVGSSIA